VAAEAGQEQRQLWLVTVRLVEVAALVLISVAALEYWAAWAASTQPPDPLSGEPTPGELSWRALAEALLFFFGGRGVISLLAAMLLLLACLGPLRLGLAAQRRVLRWEVAALAGLTGLFAVGYVVAALVMLLTDPTETFGPQPGMSIYLLGSAGVPVATAVLVAVFFLWWWPLRVDDDEAEEPVAEKASGRDGISGPDRALVDDAHRDDTKAVNAGFERVERIEPAERLAPDAGRVSSDGSTDNGYDEFFRRA
jgi:hypothetical protein